jgi:hypothetical protein
MKIGYMQGLIPENALSWATTGKQKRGGGETAEKKRSMSIG